MISSFSWTDTFFQLFAALPNTLVLFALSVSIGCVMALGIVWMRMSRNPLLSGFARGYIFVFRGTPLLIQMFLLFYGLGQFRFLHDTPAWWVLSSRFATAVASLALCTAGYSAEIFRGGLLAVPGREIEAARAIGMSGLTLLRRIIAPIALRQALPAYSTEIVLMLKSTSLASLVAVAEITGVAAKIAHTYYSSIGVFLLAGAFYLVINFIIIRVISLIEHRLSPHLRVMPARAQTPRTIVG